MIADFLLRLLVALPLVLGLAVGSILLLRRGWLPLPERLLARRFGPTLSGATRPAGEPRLELVASRVLQPGVRIALLRHGGRDYLVGVSPQGVTLLATDAAPAAGAARAEPALRPVTAEAAA
jgi:hypothetical protein